MKIVTFGEIMMRLNPSGYERLIQADNLEISYAGGEANVAVSLANLGDIAEFVTIVPPSVLGQAAINNLRFFGVNTSHIKRDGERLGLYFVEKGASQRSSKVIYDRKNSAIACATSNDFCWEEIFTDAEWFHFTGITPALGGNLPAICLEACRKAKEKNITVSCDINYRSSLWQKDLASETMKKLMPYVDVCIANEEDLTDVFGFKAGNSDIEHGIIDRAGYLSLANEVIQAFGCKYVAITLRGSISASTNKWSAMISDGKIAEFSNEYTIEIVDRVGGGDSFGGALIHALGKNWNMKESIEFAAAASCLKQTIEHDFNLVSVDEVRSLAGGNASGRVQR